ncbi:hypothetical protein RND81_01G091600 [Saponaria officinalis]|uniref:Cytochrome b561 domain-containing protein n=1 Tax=Saponaria officinalis TaxID=3572 RepID=A0AAW1NHJ3_SAPOF
MVMKGHQQASIWPVAVFANVLVVVITSLVLVWLLHFREGLAFKSHVKAKIFNIHPLLTIVGFILFSGEAIMAYKTVHGARKIEKQLHFTLHLVALLTGILGIYAVFKFHQELGIPHVYSLHSWVGLITISLYALQVHYYYNLLHHLFHLHCLLFSRRHILIFVVAIYKYSIIVALCQNILEAI